MQGTLGSEGLREGSTTITLVVVVDMVAEQPARTLWRERRKEKRERKEKVERQKSEKRKKLELH